MNERDGVILTKTANATMADGSVDFTRTNTTTLWVGGKLFLQTGAIYFRANKVSAWFTKQFYGAQADTLLDFGVDLSMVQHLTLHNTLGASTIELTLPDGTQVAFRCWGAVRVAALIGEQREGTINP